MNNVDPKIEKLKQAMNESSMDDRATDRLEQRLRSAWREQHETTPMKEKKTWKERLTVALPVSLSGATLVILAAVTAVNVTGNSTGASLSTVPTSTGNTPLSESALSDTSVQGFGDSSPSLFDRLGDLTDGAAESKRAYEPSEEAEDELSYGIVEPILPPDYDYRYDKDDSLAYGEDNEQLFDESVAMAIETEQNVIEMIDALRTEIANLDGYVVDIQYYESTGATVNLKLPSEKLTAFESYLREQDIDNTLSVSQYSIENVSEEVVQIDEVISNTEEKLEELREELKDTDVSASQKQYLEDQIERQEEYKGEKQGEREEVIAKYGLVDVELHVTEWASFWKGYYWQYDQETLGGSIKYNLAKVVYEIIRSGGGLVRFIIWLVIYGLLLTPFYLIGKRLFRKGKKIYETQQEKKKEQ